MMANSSDTQVAQAPAATNPEPPTETTGMAEFWRLCKKSLQATKAATAVEYGLLLALITMIILGSVTLMGTNLSSNFENVADSISSTDGDSGSGGGGGGSDPGGGSGGGCGRR